MSTYQITFDCADPDRMARFWAVALGYELQGPPPPYESWVEYWRNIGVPEDELVDGYDSIVDPEGARPRIWFQEVPEQKTTKNRIHLDLFVGGGRTVPIEERKRRVIEEAARLVDAGAAQQRVVDAPDVDHFFIAMADPEGNEFDVA